MGVDTRVLEDLFLVPRVLEEPETRSELKCVTSDVSVCPLG